MLLPRASPAGIVQTLTLAATGGTYRLHFVRRDPVTGILRDYVTAPIAYNASEADVLAAVSAIMNPNNANPLLPHTGNVTVRRYGNVYRFLFRGEDEATTIGWVDASALTGTLALATRMDGINYYGVETLNIDLGSGNDVFNVQGTTATTNLSLAAGDERVYVSSGAHYGQADHPDYLYGNLDQVLGALNIDAGTGRHQLMISDEAALVGDSDVRITDAPGSEILVRGLAPAPITFKAAANGTFADGVTIWSGSGADRIHIDATHERAGVRTVTSLEHRPRRRRRHRRPPGRPGRLLRARHAGRATSTCTPSPAACARARTTSGGQRARVDRSAPVAVADQPDGRVRLLASGRPDAPVSVEITRTYDAGVRRSARAADGHLHGRGARRRRHGVGDWSTARRPPSPATARQLTLTGATDGALVIVTVVAGRDASTSRCR